MKPLKKGEIYIKIDSSEKKGEREIDREMGIIIYSWAGDLIEEIYINKSSVLRMKINAFRLLGLPSLIT